MTNTVSPTINGEQAERLCGKTPSYFIMSSRQIMSASVLPLYFSSVTPLLPAASRSVLSADHLAAVADEPEPVALDNGAGADALVLPVVDAAGDQLVVTDCQRNLPSAPLKHISTPLSPLISGSRGASLLVPT